MKKQLISTYDLLKPDDVPSFFWEVARWALVRSVDTLGIDAGEHGIQGPIVSASLMNLHDPQWYEQQRRHTLLWYDIYDTDKILGMYVGDGNTTADRVLDQQNPFNFYVSKIVSQLLIDDGLDDAIFNYYTCGFAPAHSFAVMCEEYERYRNNGDVTSVRTEVVLRSDSMPTGIIVTSPGDHGEEWKKTVIFSQYYQIPIFLLRDSQLWRLDLDKK